MSFCMVCDRVVIDRIICTSCMLEFPSFYLSHLFAQMFYGDKKTFYEECKRVYDNGTHVITYNNKLISYDTLYSRLKLRHLYFKSSFDELSSDLVNDCFEWENRHFTLRSRNIKECV